MSLPRADGGGALAASPGPPGRQAQERPVLRAVRTRLRDPRDPRCPHARLPRPDVLELLLRPTRPGSPAVPVLRHRSLLRAVRPGADGGHRGVVSSRRRCARRVPVRPRAPDPGAARTRDGGGRPPAGGAARGEGAARRQEYELAAKHRDQLTAARRALESQEMVLSQPEDLDVVALAEDDLEAGFQVFFVRRGRVMGRRGWVVDRVEDLDRPGLVGSFLRELYMQRQALPPRILVPALPADADVLGEWLASRREGPVRFAVPERGTKRKLMETVSQNATEQFRRHKLRRASDFGARSRALAELGRRLELEQPPLRIECYDISNLGPTDTVGSMVVFEDGLPKRSDYRRFEIKGVPGQDDFASMEEMLRRRLARLARDREPGERRRFAYPPALIVVDGGRGQLSSAAKALADADVHIPAIGLAKRLEEVY